MLESSNNHNCSQDDNNRMQIHKNCKNSNNANNKTENVQHNSPQKRNENANISNKFICKKNKWIPIAPTYIYPNNAVMPVTKETQGYTTRATMNIYKHLEFRKQKIQTNPGYLLTNPQIVRLANHCKNTRNYPMSRVFKEPDFGFKDIHTCHFVQILDIQPIQHFNPDLKIKESIILIRLITLQGHIVAYLTKEDNIDQIHKIRELAMYQGYVGNDIIANCVAHGDIPLWRGRRDKIENSLSQILNSSSNMARIFKYNIIPRYLEYSRFRYNYNNHSPIALLSTIEWEYFQVFYVQNEDYNDDYKNEVPNSTSIVEMRVQSILVQEEELPIQSQREQNRNGMPNAIITCQIKGYISDMKKTNPIGNPHYLNHQQRHILVENLPIY